MLVRSLDGRHIEVRRRWTLWRLRKRKYRNEDAFQRFWVLDLDGISGIVFSIVFGIVLLLVGGIVLTLAVLVSEVILLFLLLLPVLLVARVLWVLPWVIEATYGDEILGVVKVRGWRASSERIREIAEMYRTGGDPLAIEGFRVEA